MKRLCRRYLQQRFFEEDRSLQRGGEIPCIQGGQTLHILHLFAELLFRSHLPCLQHIITRVVCWAPSPCSTRHAASDCWTGWTGHIHPTTWAAQQETLNHLNKVSSPAWPTQWEMTQDGRGLREGTGSWFMTYTAVEKDQNITLRVQCYNSTLPPPMDLDLGTQTTTAKPWPAEIHNMNCTKPNSNT